MSPGELARQKQDLVQLKPRHHYWQKLVMSCTALGPSGHHQEAKFGTGRVGNAARSGRELHALHQSAP